MSALSSPIYRYLAAAVAFAFLIGIGLYGGSGMLREWIIQFCYLGLFALSLNLLVGYSGMLSFGHAGFFGIGAYAFSILLRTGDVSIPVAALLTLVIVAAAALVIGFVCARLEGVFFSFITLAIQMLLYSLVIAWSDITGGEQGLIGGIPKPPFMGINLALPSHFFVTSVVVLFVGILAILRIVQSPFGTAMRMIRDNPQRAAFVGLNVLRYRTVMFVLASVFSGVAGMIMALHVSGAFPNFLYWTLSGEGMSMIVLGGLSTFLGPLVGAAVFIAINGLLNAFGGPHGLVLGGIILLIVMGFRKGILEWIRDLPPLQRKAAESGNASTFARTEA